MSTPATLAFALFTNVAMGVRGLWTALVHTVLISRRAPPAAQHTAAAPPPVPTGTTHEPCASGKVLARPSTLAPPSILAPPQSLTELPAVDVDANVDVVDITPALPASCPPLPTPSSEPEDVRVEIKVDEITPALPTSSPPRPVTLSESEDPAVDVDVDVDVDEITPAVPVSSPPLPTSESESEDQGLDVDEITPAVPASPAPLTSNQLPPATSAPSESEVADVGVDEITPAHPTTPTPHPPPPPPPPAPQTREARLYTVNPPPLDAPLPMYVRRPRPSASPRVTRARHCDFANQNLELWNFVMHLEGQIPGLPCPKRANPSPYPDKAFSKMPLGMMGTVPRRCLPPGSGRGRQKMGIVEEPLAATLVGGKISAKRSKKKTTFHDEGASKAPHPVAEEVQSSHRPSGCGILKDSGHAQEGALTTAVNLGTEVVESSLRPSVIAAANKKVRFQDEEAITVAPPATEKVHRPPVRGILKKRVPVNEDALTTAVHRDTEAVEPARRPVRRRVHFLDEAPAPAQDSVLESVQSGDITSAIRAVKRVTFQDEAPATAPRPVTQAVECPEKVEKKRPVTLRELVEQIEQAEAATPSVTTHRTTRRPPPAASAARDAGAPRAQSNRHMEGRRTGNWARRVRERVMQVAQDQRDRSARVVQRVRNHFAVPTFILQEREPCAA